MITDEIVPARLAVVDVGRWLLALAGGVPGPLQVPGTIADARVGAARVSVTQAEASAAAMKQESAKSAPAPATGITFGSAAGARSRLASSPAC